MNSESQNEGTDLKSASLQRKLLLAIAAQHFLSKETGFTLVRSPNQSTLAGSSGLTIPCNSADEDFYLLERAGFITLSRNTGGQLCGHISEKGVAFVFGSEKDRVVGGLKDIVAASDWEKEERSFFVAEAMEKMPPESSTPEDFANHALNLVSRRFDIQVQSTLRLFPRLDQISDTDYEKLLSILEDALVTGAAKIRMSFIPTWPVEVKRALAARKQFW